MRQLPDIVMESTHCQHSQLLLRPLCPGLEIRDLPFALQHRGVDRGGSSTCSALVMGLAGLC